MNEVILHHYWGSPYAEKVRLLLGYKGIAWRSLEIAPTPPRESLQFVFGTFRRTPVLQLGADFFCDTRLIAQVLDGLSAEQPLDTGYNQALSALLCGWAEPRVFVMTGPIRFQTAADVDGVFDGAVDAKAFQHDRMPFMSPILDPHRFSTLRPSAEDHLHLYLDVIDRALRDTHGYLGGSRPTFADFSAYHLVWWLRRPPAHAELLTGFPQLLAWADRMGAIGHGNHVAAQIADAFAAVAASQSDHGWQSQWPPTSDDRLGSPVTIAADDYGRDTVSGTLLASSARHVTIERGTTRGIVRMHFPRLGYEVRAQAARSTG